MAIKLSKEAKINLKTVVIPMMEANLRFIDMSTWLDEKPDLTGETNECGTIGCLAGFICLANGYTSKRLVKIQEKYGDEDEFETPKGATPLLAKLGCSWGRVYIPNVAKALMGVDPDESLDQLFFVGCWPRDFLTAFEDLDRNSDNWLNHRKSTQLKLAKLVIKRLKHFIKTGE